MLLKTKSMVNYCENSKLFYNYGFLNISQYYLHLNLSTSIMISTFWYVDIKINS